MLAISIMGPSWAHNLKIGYKLAALSFISVIIFFINNFPSRLNKTFSPSFLN